MDGPYIDKYQLSFYSSELLGRKQKQTFLTVFFPLHILLFVLSDAMHSSKTNYKINGYIEFKM